jgi:hypothetical protein
MFKTTAAQLYQGVNAGIVLYRNYAGKGEELDNDTGSVTRVCTGLVFNTNTQARRESMTNSNRVEELSWQTVANYAGAKEKMQGYVSQSDLMRAFGISKSMARRFIDILKDSGEWESAISRID